MLAPRASSAFVCIRCELQHFARPNLTALARRPPRAAAFSTSPRSRDEGDALQPQGDGPRISRVQVSSERPLDRPRRRKGNARLRETTASLGEVKTLGENSEILVLRDMGDDPPVEEDKKPADIVESLPSDAVNIVEALQDQRRPITPEEIVNQLESLRPKTYATPDEPQYVNQTTFIRLARKLMQSFTGQQLSHYYSVTKGVARKNVDKKVLDSLKELQAKADRPAQRSGWHPGTTQIDQRLPSLDVHKRSKRKAISKNLLVDQIMRDVWELVLLEEIESPGEVELQIKPWQLSLLNSGSSLSPLDRIGRDRKVKIEYHSAHSIVRITADKISAEYAADDVEQLLQSVEVKYFDLRAWAPYLEKHNAPEDTTKLFSAQGLHLVTEMTEANVSIKPSNAIMIRALNKDSIAEAERCLIKLLPLKKNVRQSIDTLGRDAAKDQSYLLPVHFDKSSVKYLSRNQNFGRWVMPITQADTPNSGPELATGEPLQDKLLEMIEHAAKVPEGLLKIVTGDWTILPEIRVGAQFGQLLFSMDSSFNEVEVEAEAESEPSSLPFLTAIPGFSKLLSSGEFNPKLRSRLPPPLLNYTFIAAPDQKGFEKGQHFPELSVSFRHNEETGKQHFHKLSLNFNQSAHDVLLPGKAVDVRYVANTQLRLQKGALESRNIMTFVRAINRNQQSGGKLTAPSIDLDIPTWTIPGQPLDPKGTTKVKYLFTGVGYRQSVTAKLLNSDVIVSTLQGGKLSQKGAGMTALHNSYAAGQDRILAELRDRARVWAFLDKTKEMVDLITQTATNDQSMVPWKTNRKFLRSEVEDEVQLQKRARDPKSARKIRREALQNTVVGEATKDGAEEAGSTEDLTSMEMTNNDAKSITITTQQVPEDGSAVTAENVGGENAENVGTTETTVQIDAKELEVSHSAVGGQLEQLSDRTELILAASESQGRESSPSQHLDAEDMSDPFLDSILSTDSSPKTTDNSFLLAHSEEFNKVSEEPKEVSERENHTLMESVGKPSLETADNSLYTSSEEPNKISEHEDDDAPMKSVG